MQGCAGSPGPARVQSLCAHAGDRRSGAAALSQLRASKGLVAVRVRSHRSMSATAAAQQATRSRHNQRRRSDGCFCACLIRLRASPCPVPLVGWRAPARVRQLVLTRHVHCSQTPLNSLSGLCCASLRVRVVSGSASAPFRVRRVTPGAMLSEKQIKIVIKTVNDNYNIPILSESHEGELHAGVLRVRARMLLTLRVNWPALRPWCNALLLLTPCTHSKWF